MSIIICYFLVYYISFLLLRLILSIWVCFLHTLYMSCFFCPAISIHNTACYIINLNNVPCSDSYYSIHSLDSLFPLHQKQK